MSLGQRLRTRRESLNVTQQQLARAVGLSAQHISAIEVGRRDPSLETLALLAKELGVSTDYLITGEVSVVSDLIPVIKADKVLDVKLKSSLINIIQALKNQKP